MSNIKTELYDLWTSKALEEAKVIESSQTHTTIRTASQTIYRAYQEGLKALYTTDNITELKWALRRRLHNPFKAPRHATYVSMLHHIATVEGSGTVRKEADR